VTVVPKCYFFSIYTVNIQNKEIKGKNFRLGLGKFGLEFAGVLSSPKIRYSATLYGEWS
jgi:hypothetical protein